MDLKEVRPSSIFIGKSIHLLQLCLDFVQIKLQLKLSRILRFFCSKLWIWKTNTKRLKITTLFRNCSWSCREKKWDIKQEKRKKAVLIKTGSKCHHVFSLFWLGDNRHLVNRSDSREAMLTSESCYYFARFLPVSKTKAL